MFDKIVAKHTVRHQSDSTPPVEYELSHLYEKQWQLLWVLWVRFLVGCFWWRPPTSEIANHIIYYYFAQLYTDLQWFQRANTNWLYSPKSAGSSITPNKLDSIQNVQELEFLDLTQYAKYFSLLVSSLLSCCNNYNCTHISRALELDPVFKLANKGSGSNLLDTPFPFWVKCP